MAAKRSAIPDLDATLNAQKLIPKKFQGKDTFLDVVSWNLRWFNGEDQQRVKRVSDILQVLNGDLLVFQEIRNESLDAVAEMLNDRGAGHYVVDYGCTGGDQRVAIMHDLDWVRAKDDINELFGKGQVVAPDGKDAFPRLPLWGYFTGLRRYPRRPPFDFQFVGLHLKSQRGGGDVQRATSAARLADWLTREAIVLDADVIMMGDWNAPPSADVWEPLRQLERGTAGAEPQVGFSRINAESDYSHLMYRNLRNIGSRLDIGAVSAAALKEMKSPPTTVRWKTLDAFLAKHPRAKELKAFLREVTRTISDHMPVVSRFYFEERR